MSYQALADTVALLTELRSSVRVSVVFRSSALLVHQAWPPAGAVYVVETAWSATSTITAAEGARVDVLPPTGAIE